MSFVKRALVTACTLLIISMAMNWSLTETVAQGQNQLPLTQPPPGEPDVTPDDDKNDQIFYRKNLSVRNQTNERITVFLQFRTFNPMLKKWEWQPSVPASGQAVAFDIEPGEEKLLETVDRKIVASYVRIWATSENMMWNNFRNNDFYLVPMSENGVREYKAFKLETFTYVFNGPRNPDPEFLEPPVPYNMAVEYAQPLNIIPDQDPNTVISNSSPINQFIAVPLTLSQTVVIPEVIPPPVIPIVREADLAVLGLEVQSEGIFSGRIRNNGPSTYLGGRAWFLLASINDGPFRTVMKGAISGLRPGSGMFVSGTFPRVTQPSRFVLMLTPGDLQPDNDFMGIRVMPPPRADLAVTNLQFNNGVVSVNVINNGPTEYSGFFRRCSIMDTRSVLTTGPLSKIVPALAAGQQVSLQFPVANIDPGPGNALVAMLNHGDVDPSNDRVSKPLNSNNVIVQGRDFAAGTPFLNGNQLTAVITSDSGMQFGNHFFSLSYESLDGFKRSDQIRGTITATAGAPQTVQLSLPPRMLNIPFQASLTLTRDANPTNNVATKTFNANQGTAVADIQVLSAMQFKVNPNNVVVKIRNNGPDAYTGNKLVMISGNNGLASNTTPIRTGTSINAGETVRVSLTMNNGMPSGQYTITLGQTTPDSTKIIDNNTTNETLVFNYVATSTPPGPIAGGMGVGINAFTIDNTGKVSLGISIDGARPASGTIRVTITSPNSKTISRVVPGVNLQSSERNWTDSTIASLISKLKPGGTERFTATVEELDTNNKVVSDSNAGNNVMTFDYVAGGKPMGGMGVGINSFTIDNNGQVNLGLSIKGGRPSTGSIRVTITSPNLASPSITEIPGISFNSPAKPWTDSKIAELINKLKKGAKETFTVTVAEKNAGENASSTFEFTAAGKPSRTQLSVSDLKVDQNGNVTFKLTNNGGSASLANADQFSISSSSSPSNTKATPAVPAKSTVVVGDGSPAGGSVSVAAIVNKMKPNEKTTFTVQLQSNQATVRSDFTKANLSALTVSEASINPVTKDLTFFLTNQGPDVSSNSDSYFVTSDPQIPGDIARAGIPAMPTNSRIKIDVKGSAAKLAQLTQGKVIEIKLNKSGSVTTFNYQPTATQLTISNGRVDPVTKNIMFDLKNVGEARKGVVAEYSVRGADKGTFGSMNNLKTPAKDMAKDETVTITVPGSDVNVKRIENVEPITITLKSGASINFTYKNTDLPLQITQLTVAQNGTLSFNLKNANQTDLNGINYQIILNIRTANARLIDSGKMSIKGNSTITKTVSVASVVNTMKPGATAEFTVSIPPQAGKSGIELPFTFKKQ